MGKKKGQVVLDFVGQRLWLGLLSLGFLCCMGVEDFANSDNVLLFENLS